MILPNLLGYDMRKITSVSMGEQLDGSVQRMVESGRYGSVSEVMTL